MNMVKKVARALAKLITEPGQHPDSEMLKCSVLARAAIEAMHEPSEEMNFASNQIVDIADSGKDIWEAMIDAALKDAN